MKRLNTHTTLKFPFGSPQILRIAALALLIPLNPAWAGEPPDEPVDCEVYETTRYGITVGFRVGNMLLNAGPDVTFTREQGVAWNRVSQGIIAKYMELCSRYNAGAVSKEEYQKRLDDIERLHREARELELRMIQNVRDRRNAAVGRMEEAFARKSQQEKTTQNDPVQSDPLAQEANQLSQRIEDLEPASGTLEPTKPCPPPDVIGTPGARDVPCK